MVFLGGVRGGRGNVRSSTEESFSLETRVSNIPIFSVIYYILSSGGFTVSCFKTIGNGVPDLRYPGQTRVLLNFRQPDNLFHTLKSNKKMKKIVLEFKRTTDSSESYYQDMWKVVEYQHTLTLMSLGLGKKM